MGACGASNELEDGGSGTGTIIAVVVVIVVLVLCIVGFCVWRRMNQNDAMKMREQVHGGLPTGTLPKRRSPMWRCPPWTQRGRWGTSPPQRTEESGWNRMEWNGEETVIKSR